MSVRPGYVAFILTVAVLCSAVIGYCLHGNAVPRVCHFDGGGTIQAGEFGRTDTGTYVCTVDSKLVRVQIQPQP